MSRAPVRRRPELSEVLNFLADVSRALLECGCSSHRLENLCVRLGRDYETATEVLAIPTGVWIKVQRGEEQLIDLIRVKHWAVNLDKLSTINQYASALVKRDLPLSEARRQLNRALARSAPYPRALIVLSGAVASGSYVFLNQGSWVGSLLAMCGGAVAQAVISFGGGNENRRFLGDFLGAIMVSALVLGVVESAKFWGVPSGALAGTLTRADQFRIVTGGLIALFPGLTFVNAIHEIAQKNLVSGTARLLEALMAAVALAFGVGLVFGLRKFFAGL